MRQVSKRVIVITLFAALLVNQLIFVGAASAQSAVCYVLTAVFQGGPGGASAYSALYDSGIPVASDVIKLEPGEIKTINLYAFVTGSAGGIATISGGSILGLTLSSVGDAKCAVAGSLSGPDMVPIPAGAVMGTFTANTALQFEPIAGATSPYVMTIGQSLWVFGLDTSGTFYMVLLSGQTYWVPVGSIGPTYSAPWNGAALPTTVIATAGG